MRLDYSGKVRLLTVMGTTANLTQPLIALGGIRNEFAHKLNFKLTLERMKAFYKTFDSVGRAGVHNAYESTRLKAPELKHPRDMWQLDPKDLFSLLAASLRAMLLVASMHADRDLSPDRFQESKSVEPLGTPPTTTELSNSEKVDAPKGIPDDKQFLDRLANALGYIAVNFGQLEFTRTAAISIIFHFIEGRDQVRKKLPYTFSGSTEFLCACADGLPALAPFADEIRSLMDESKRLAEKRNHVLHGFVSDYLKDTETLVFRKVDPMKSDKNMHAETVLRITFAELEELGEQSRELSARMISFTQRLLGAFAPRG